MTHYRGWTVEPTTHEVRESGAQQQQTLQQMMSEEGSFQRAKSISQKGLDTMREITDLTHEDSIMGQVGNN